LDLKKVFIIVGALLIEFFFLSKELKFSFTQKLNQNDISVEFVKSNSYFITNQGIDRVLIAQKIDQYSGYKVFYKPVVTIYDENFTKTIVANQAKYTDKSGVLELEKNVKVVYMGKKLETSKLLYDTKKQEVFDSAKFKLTSKKFTAFGNHLYFDVKNNIIKSKEINFKFKE